MLLNSDSRQPVRIVALITTYNRELVLMQCLRSLDDAAEYSNLEVNVVLSNCGSSIDVTKFAAFKNVTLKCIELDSSFFWASAMRKAWEFAQLTFDYTHLLWVNDDVEIYPNALDVLLYDETGKRHYFKGPISGAVESAEHVSTYGGKKIHSKLQPLKFLDLDPNGKFQDCDTFNGNIVLVEKDSDSLLGGFPRDYRQNRADLAYGLLAKRMGLQPKITPTYVGRCEDNPHSGDFMDRSLSKRRRLTLLLSPKGIPVDEWFRFTLTFGGVLFPIYFLGPYIKFLVKRNY